MTMVFQIICMQLKKMLNYRQYMSALSNNNARASSGYSKYFNSSKWITRNGVVSLSINFQGSALYPNDLPAANYAVANTAF